MTALGRARPLPDCGAPVDQAKAWRDPDPFCGFCHQPVPVEPAR